MKPETRAAETYLRAVNYRAESSRPLKWPRLLARFNYREPRRHRKGGAR